MPAGKGRIGQNENKIIWLWFPPNNWSSVQWLLPPQLQSQTPFTPPSPWTLRAPGRAFLQGVCFLTYTEMWMILKVTGWQRWTRCRFPSPGWDIRSSQLVLHYAHLKQLQLCISILKHSFILLLQRPAPALHKSLMKRSASSTVPMNKRQSWRETVLPPKKPKQFYK